MHYDSIFLMKSFGVTRCEVSCLYHGCSAWFIQLILRYTTSLILMESVVLTITNFTASLLLQVLTAAGLPILPNLIHENNEEAIVTSFFLEKTDSKPLLLPIQRN
mmetsp:Transcript_36977/g.60367  ORF Transcript_36977/g.60367 Transcript_36977/m.60367 type:complete len:105 (-) Transcript_36977:534-848(-)